VPYSPADLYRQALRHGPATLEAAARNGLGKALGQGNPAALRRLLQDEFRELRRCGVDPVRLNVTERQRLRDRLLTKMLADRGVFPPVGGA